MSISTTQEPPAALPVATFGGRAPTRPIGRVERLLGPDNYRLLRGMLTTPISIAGMVLIAFFVVTALAAPLIIPPVTPTDPYRIPRDGFSPDPKPMLSTWTRNAPALPFWWKPIMRTDRWVHILGTASGQFDIFYGVVWGTRTAFRVGVTITLLALLIGMIVGGLAGFYGGWVDNVLMRGVDVFMTLPYLMAALIISAVLTPRFGHSIYPLMIALVAFGWMTYARLLRGDILAIRQREYVLAARVIGASDPRIMLKHILPNAIFPTFVQASLDVGTYVLSFAGLSFLGIGAEPGYADWGQLLSFARDWITSLHLYWYVVAWPGLALILFVLAWTLLGDALRDVLDPRMRKR